MKTYNQHNFFKHTFCEFIQVDDFKFPEKTNYKSKSNSCYHYTKEGVYRKSNHWGRVANCRWKIISNSKYKNQKEVIGFAKWSDFYPINSTEKIFCIDIDFTTKTVQLRRKKENLNTHLFTYTEAQKRIKQIHDLFQNDKWTLYFEVDKETLVREVILALINSKKSLQEIKKSFK